MYVVRGKIFIIGLIIMFDLDFYGLENTTTIITLVSKVKGYLNVSTNLAKIKILELVRKYRNPSHL